MDHVQKQTAQRLLYLDTDAIVAAPNVSLDYALKAYKPLHYAASVPYRELNFALLLGELYCMKSSDTDAAMLPDSAILWPPYG